MRSCSTTLLLIAGALALSPLWGAAPARGQVAWGGAALEGFGADAVRMEEAVIDALSTTLRASFKQQKGADATCQKTPACVEKLAEEAEASEVVFVRGGRQPPPAYGEVIFEVYDLAGAHLFSAARSLRQGEERADLEALVVRTFDPKRFTGTLKVPAGAVVRVDGLPASGDTLVVSAGPHVVEIDDDRGPRQQRVEVPYRGELDVAALKPAAVSLPVWPSYALWGGGAVLGVVATATAADATGLAETLLSLPSSEDGRAMSTLIAVGTGVSAVPLLVGGALYTVALLLQEPEAP